MIHPERLTPRETPVRFRVGRDELFGILTAPTAPPREVGVILLAGGACTPSTGRNQFSVRMARRLAATGFHVLRFDYHGVGESTGRVVRYSLNRPFTADLVGAVNLLRRVGLRGCMFIGRCFGARTALAAAEHVGDVRGLAFISMPLHEFSPQGDGDGIALGAMERGTMAAFLHPRQRGMALRAGYHAVQKGLRRLRLQADRSGPDWLSADVVRWLDMVVGRGIPLLFLYGSKDAHYTQFRQATSGPLSRLLAGPGGRTALWTTDEAVHDLSSLSVQESIIARVSEWAEVASAGIV